MKNLIFLVTAILLAACSKQGTIQPQRGKHNQQVVTYAPAILSNDPVQQWGLSDIGAPQAWANGHTGSKSVLIGLIDEGFDKSIPLPVVNLDIIDNISTVVPGINMTQWRQNNPGLGIGTNIAGIIGAKHDNGIGTLGVCKDVSLIDAKCIYNWSYFKSDIAAALRYFIDLKEQGHNIVAIQNAWDWYSGADSTILALVKEAGQNNILYIRASGFHTHIDGGHATPESNAFAALPNVITVSAINENGDVQADANTSEQFVDLYAPGEFTPFAPMVYIPNWAFYNGTVLHGTPIAASYVTGAVALYAASHPQATATEIKAAIMNSVVKDDRYNASLWKGKLNISTF